MSRLGHTSLRILSPAGHLTLGIKDPSFQPSDTCVQVVFIAHLLMFLLASEWSKRNAVDEQFAHGLQQDGLLARRCRHLVVARLRRDTPYDIDGNNDSTRGNYRRTELGIESEIWGE